MTWLIRKIDDPEPWLDLGDDANLATLAANPPLWAVRLFIPSSKDKGSLSLYEVKDEEEAKQVAAAWGFNIGDIDKPSKSYISFIAVRREEIESAGFTIESSLGALNHTTDSKHVGISLSNLDEAKTLAGLFITGTFFPFEGKTVQTAAIEEAQANRFKFGIIAKKGSGSTAARNILSLIGNEKIYVSGVKAEEVIV